MKPAVADPSAAADLLDVKPKELSRFDDVPDLFNPPNRLGGWLCRRGDHRYGALVIDAVLRGHIGMNQPACGLPVVEPQVIYGTPKLELGIFELTP